MPVPCGEIINDIEDLLGSLEMEPKERYSYRKKVKLRAHKTDKVENENYNASANKMESGSIVPGTHSIYVKTWGCAHNSSDSEYMSGQLATYGYRLTDTAEAADLWLLNSCTVKGPAEDHFRNEIERGQRLGKHIVTAGCVPQGAPRSSYLTGLSAIGVHNIDRVVEVVEETLKGHSVRLFGQKKSKGKKLGGADLELPKVRKNRFVEIIAISTGCLNQCTYCKTKHARGELGSYPPEAIVERAVQAFAEGVKEIWLTSEDTGAYGRDIGHNLPDLLWALVAVIPAGCMLRLGMTNPPYILEHLEAMAAILNHPRVYKFLHVPVQSGSDQVLSDMKREYTAAQFIHVVTFLRNRVPGISIATDVICAFPTETEADFQLTVDMCQQLKFPSLFINQFYPRPGTPAARLPRVPPQEAKRRTRVVTNLFQSYETYGDQLGREMDVLITEESRDGLQYIAHNAFYHQVLLDKNDKGELLGTMQRASVTSTKKHCLIAQLCDARSAPLTSQQLEISQSRMNLFTVGLLTPTLICLLFAILIKLFSLVT